MKVTDEQAREFLNRIAAQARCPFQGDRVDAFVEGLRQGVLGMRQELEKLDDEN